MKELIKKLNLNYHIREMKNFELNEETMNNVGEWPVIVKLIVSCLLAIGLCVLANQFYFKSLKNEYKSLVLNEVKLKDEVKLNIQLTAGQEQYKEKIKEMNDSFKTLLKKLPTDIEMDGLLEDITNKGISNGIEFKKLQMLKPIKTEFYTEHPIEIVIDGTYHSLSKFIGDISNLNRIVTFHDFELSPSKKENDLLELKVMAKTYKYRNKDEEVKNETN